MYFNRGIFHTKPLTHYSLIYIPIYLAGNHFLHLQREQHSNPLLTTKESHNFHLAKLESDRRFYFSHFRLNSINSSLINCHNTEFAENSIKAHKHIPQQTYFNYLTKY